VINIKTICTFVAEYNIETMGIVIGIDVGGSTTKIVGINGEHKCTAHTCQHHLLYIRKLNAVIINILPESPEQRRWFTHG